MQGIKGWAEDVDIVQSGRSVDGVKGVLGLYQESPFDVLFIEDESHGMDRCFAATHLVCTHLQRASSILDVGGEDPQDGFGKIRRGTSPIPIGLTPGDLSKGIRRHATKALRPSGSTREVHNRRPTAARKQHRSLEAALNEEHSLRHAKASSPESPAAPLVLSAAFKIRSALRLSKMMELEATGC